MDAEQIRYVVEDLEYLRSDWGPDVSEPDIRRGSAVLRRLLVEGVYGQAWRAVGFDKQPSVSAVDLDVLIGPDQDRVACSLALGAHFRGIMMASPMIMRGQAAPRPNIPKVREGELPGQRAFSLSKYLESTSGLADGIIVNRREVIKYVANVKGGVHLSQKTKAKEKELIKKMKRFERKIQVATTDGILVELVAIAQAVGQSSDAQELIAAV